MTVSASILQRLAVLGLPPDAMREVLTIVAEIQAAHETTEAKILARLSKDRARKRRGKSTEVPSEAPPKEKNQTPPPVANATAHELQTDLVWKTSPDRLVALGLTDRAARSNLGRWLKGSAPAKVLEAVDAAVRVGTRDPIPYITEALKPKGIRKNGTGWYITPDSDEYEAWKKYALKISDYSLLSRLKYNTGEVKVPTRWPNK